MRAGGKRVNRLCLIVYWKHFNTFIKNKHQPLLIHTVHILSMRSSGKSFGWLWRSKMEAVFFFLFANLASTQPVTLWHTKGKPHWLKTVMNLYSTTGRAGVRVTWTSKLQSGILCKSIFQISTQLAEKMWTSKNHRYVKLNFFCMLQHHAWRNWSNLAA